VWKMKYSRGEVGETAQLCSLATQSQTPKCRKQIWESLIGAGKRPLFDSNWKAAPKGEQEVATIREKGEGESFRGNKFGGQNRQGRENNTWPKATFFFLGRANGTNCLSDGCKLAEKTFLSQFREPQLSPRGRRALQIRLDVVCRRPTREDR